MNLTSEWFTIKNVINYNFNTENVKKKNFCLQIIIIIII